ncbi:RagB/SusD family nutrient uptake outer membrane protein [Sphingobacterium sp. xlx-130]|uniref:RagB/SusD family nutrient uptake outer membrane protein n=1 Tax=Sphingobacterium sp. xlx-130 TaxID=2654323 RepID=UPI0013DB7ED2|nr:RagB/SusD family nutrient uptake outer membrane protein [Sphingobacterium sp. xlx-130]
MKLITIYCTISLVLFASCNDFLDVKPKGMSIPQTVEDYNLILNMTNGAVGNTYSSPETYFPLQEMSSLSLVTILSYSWAEYIYPENESSSHWNGLYSRIYACNEILENVENATSVNSLNETLRKNVKGQAHAERARCYFVLINTYAKHYTAESINELGVPLILKNDISQKSKRATIGEVYKQIQSDLNQAIDLVPEKVEDNEKAKPTKQGVYVLMAKVGLFMNDIEAATKAINRAFEFPSLLLKYSNYIRANPKDLYDRSTLPTTYNMISETLWQGNTSSNFWAAKAFYADNLLNEFDKENDLRFYFFSCNTDRRNENIVFEDYRYVNRISRTHAASTPEMYLIRAECNARVGNKDLAMKDINILRAHRFRENSNYELSASNKEEAIVHVKKERLRELAFTGLNWFDLRRYHAYGENVPTFERILNNGQTATLTPGSNRYVAEIPRYIISLNPNIEQNPR